MTQNQPPDYIARMRRKVGHDLLILPGARIVIENEAGEILLQLRGDFRRWGLPGGGAEEGQSLVDVIEREVLEETGLTVNRPGIFGIATDPVLETVTYPNGDRCQYHVLQFWTRTWSGDLYCDNEETLQLGWYPPDDLPDVMENMRRSIEAYRDYTETGTFQVF